MLPPIGRPNFYGERSPEGGMGWTAVRGHSMGMAEQRVIGSGIDSSLAQALDHYRMGIGVRYQGQSSPYAGCWERSSDVTLYGAWGPIDKGIEAIDATLRWVAGRCSGGTQTQVELSTVFEQATLAYSVGFERTTLSIAGRAPRRMVLRVTQVYRSSDGEWRIVHRHADELPEDQRQLSD